MVRCPTPHPVCRFHPRCSNLRRHLGMVGVSEAGYSLRSSGEGGHEGHGHSLQHDRPDRWPVHICVVGDLPAVHHLANQSLLPDLCGGLPALVHRGNDFVVLVLLLLGCLERGEESPAHRAGCPAEPGRDHYVICDRRTDVVHEYTGEGGRHISGGVPRDRHAVGQSTTTVGCQ